MKPNAPTQNWVLFLLSLLIFMIPIEHKYDNPLRRFSLTLIPDGLILPEGFDPKIFFYASDIIALILFGYCLYQNFSKLFEKTAILLWTIFFLALLSSYLSPLSHYPLIYIRLLQLFTPITLFSVITQTPNIERHTKYLFFAFVAAGVLQSLFAMGQYFLQEPLGLRLLSESRDPPTVFQMNEGRRWLIDSFTGFKLPGNTVFRSAGTLPHANTLGGFLMLSILVSFPLILREKRAILRGILYSTLPLQLFALNLSFSRSGIFAFILGSALFFTLMWFKQKEIRIQKLFLILSLSFVGIAGLLFEQNLARGGLLNYNQTSKNADQERLGAQAKAFEMIKDSPALGVGFQQFSTASKKYEKEGEKPVGVHNIYLYLDTEMGHFALLSFLGFIALLLFRAFKAKITPELASMLAIFLGFLFIGGCDFYPLIFQQGKLMFFIIAALLYIEAKPKESLLCQN